MDWETADRQRAEFCFVEPKDKLLAAEPCDASAGGLLTPVFPSPFVLVFKSSMQSLSLTLSAIPHGTIRPSDVRYGCERWLITPNPPLSFLLLEVYSISILGIWATVCDSVYIQLYVTTGSVEFCLPGSWHFLSAKIHFKINDTKLHRRDALFLRQWILKLRYPVLWYHIPNFVHKQSTDVSE